MKCCVPFCEPQSSENASISFFKFPVTRWLKSSWLVAIGMSEIQWQPDSVVCSQHFQTDDILVKNNGPLKLRKNSVPSIFRDNCMDNNLQKNEICHFNSEPQLCTECTQRLINCYKFREKCLKTHRLIMMLHSKRGMLTLNKIKSINRATQKLKSTLAEHVIAPDHYDLYVHEDFVDIQEVNTGITETNTEMGEFNTEISGANNGKSDKPILEEADLDFDIDDEAVYISDKNLIDTNVQFINKKHINDEYSDKVINVDSDDESMPRNDINNDDFTNDDRDSDVECLDDDTNDESDYSDDFDSYLKFLNNNIVSKNDINNGRRTKVIGNAKKKKKLVDYKKKRVSLKNILLVKDAKVNIIKSTKNKHSKTDKSCSENVKRRDKSKLRSSDLKLFTVSVLSYEEQLADIQKRKQSFNYKCLPYKCNICYRGSWHPVPYNRHMEKHTVKYGLLECAICGFHKKIRSKLISHIQVNHQYRFSCQSCSYVTTSIWQAKGHEQWHGGKVFKCQNCDLEFAKKSSYLSHLRTKHPSASHICTLCGYSYVSAIGLKSHTTIQHRFEKPRKLDGPTCEECDIRFASVTAYERHKKVSPKHNAEKKSIRNEQNLSKNRRTTGVRSSMEQCPMLCELCGKTFRLRTQLSYHVRKHAGEKKFKCSHCDKRFYNKKSLVIHMESHSNEPASSCDACGKVVITPSNRHRHMALHKDAKPCYKCDI
ncbi:zinc finger protein 354B-like isoform X3 [Pararge aegeria]|uniref:zinc finger protein 354B-like isoform X3 n=1 Tax=Pararge aegeria TaxID=116150 RepID=UPI0019D116CC|nr:zinc finger protein 354B-like isoform X3 [Pararge aegeria]